MFAGKWSSSLFLVTLLLMVRLEKVRIVRDILWR
jgi:hypothetical protein